MTSTRNNQFWEIYKMVASRFVYLLWFRTQLFDVVKTSQLADILKYCKSENI